MARCVLLYLYSKPLCGGIPFDFILYYDGDQHAASLSISNVKIDTEKTLTRSNVVCPKKRREGAIVWPLRHDIVGRRR
jgi:hypothetical protein